MAVHKIELGELESVLQQTLGPQLKVVSYSSESLLPVGENYGSTIMKVRAIVKRSSAAPEEQLHLVAKMLPATDFQRNMFDSPFTFKKETFFYRQLVPAYQQLQRQFSLPIEELFDNLPKFYGARYSTKEDGTISDDTVILMENLKVLGYYTVDRRKGMDGEHARKAIEIVARFHALGMALKQHSPEFFQTVKRYSKCMKFEIDESDEIEIEAFVKMMRDDPEVAPYCDQIERSLKLDQHELWESEGTEPWATITHMDLWVNNIMFRRDSKADRVADVKFVDFQNFLFMSPLRELVFFLLLNMDVHEMDNEFDALIDCYYDKFISELKKFECDTEPYSRDEFDERMKLDAFLEFSHCPFMTKVMTREVTDESNMEEIENFMQTTDVSPRFMERIRMYVKKYAEKGWFTKNEK